jgi:hypothetical protein
MRINIRIIMPIAMIIVEILFSMRIFIALILSYQSSSTNIGGIVLIKDTELKIFSPLNINLIDLTSWVKKSLRITMPFDSLPIGN